MPEQQPATRLQHPRALGKQSWLVRDMSKGLLRNGKRERCVMERHVQRIAVDEAHGVGQPRNAREFGGTFHSAGRQVQAGDVAASLPGKVACRSTHATADVQHHVFGPHGRLGD